ncbi:MAG: hypothetical protein EPO06_08830 [Burkholderiaceae bacterium]|nr:MAG: hypothetical protein EPO06_08830 [Burkholderiaceae bacterium]
MERTQASIARAALLAPSADNSQPWAMRWRGRTLEISYSPHAPVPQVFKADSHATLLAAGALAENLVAACATNGISVDLQWSAEINDCHPFLAATLNHLPDHFTVPARVEQRHTNRGAFRSTALPDALLTAMGRCSEGGNRLLALRDRSQRIALSKLIRICSEARFCNRDLHEWLFDSLRFTPAEAARGNGLDVRCLGLPPGGKIFLRFISDWGRLSMLNRLGAYKLLARSEAMAIATAPALLCVVGHRQPPDVIQAGRLMTRIWQECNAQGIAVHPFYVVTDQIQRLHAGALATGFAARITAVENDLHTLLQLQPDEMLHMVLRVGYPASVPVRSQRLPLDAVMRDDTAD